MRLSVALPLAIAVVAQAAALPQRATNVTHIAATGYKNVAYFVNWVSFVSLFGSSPPLIIYTVGYLRPQLQPTESARIRANARALRFRQRPTRDWRGLSFRYLV